MKTTDNLKLNSPELSDAANVLKISENFEKLDKLFETLSVKKSKTAVSEFNSKCCMPYIRFINESEEDITVTDSSAEEETTFTVKAGESYVEWISEASVTPDYSFSAALDVNYFVLVADAIGSGGGGGGTSDYAELSNKPKINNVELSGNKSLSDIGAGTYSKPTAGIPKTDLSEAVQLSLGRADTALQTEAHTGDYSKPSGGIPKTDLAAAVQNSLSLADTALQTEAHTGDYSKPSGGIPASDMTQSVQEALGKAHSHDNKSVLDGITAEKITQIGTNKSDISTIKTYINNGGSEAKNGTTCTINVPENVSDFASIAMVGGKTVKVTPESGDPYLVSAPVEKIVSKSDNLFYMTNTGSGTSNGVTYTINNDNSITLNGTSTNTVTIALMGKQSEPLDIFGDDTYSLIWSDKSGTTEQTGTGLKIGNTSGAAYDSAATSSSKIYTITGNVGYIYFRASSGKTFDNLTIYPKLVKGTATSSEYSAPFETELSLTEITKNLPDYGCSISDTCYNYIDFETGKYYHNVSKFDIADAVGSYVSSDGYFYINNVPKKYGATNSISSIYTTSDDSVALANLPDMSYRGNISSQNLFFKDSRYTTYTQWIAAIKDSDLYFELATPEVIDLADTLYPIECESGGTITFVNEHSLDVPNKVIYKKEV